MTQKITQRAIKKIATPESGGRILWDSELKGFGTRITAAGAVTFFLNYRVHGRQRRYKIGRAPEWGAEAARSEAAKIKQKVDAEGFDPLEQKRLAKGEPTLSDLATEYLERHATANKRPSSVRNDRQTFDGIILPRLGALRLAAIGTRDIESLKVSLKATPYRANRVLALLSHMFSKAIEWKWAKENPARGVKRYQEEKRERWLSDEEMGAFVKAIDGHHDQGAANALRLLLLTGARKGEVLSADWTQFDLQRGVWTKPSHHTKQKKTEHVPLSAETLKLLRGMRPEDETGQLFPPRKDGARCMSLRKAWAAVCKAAGLADSYTVEKVNRRGKRRTITKWRPTLRIHDLRHTYASHLVSHGTSLQVVGRLLGHTQVATTMRYAHLADGALRDATNGFGKIFREASKAKVGLHVVNSRKRAPTRVPTQQHGRAAAHRGTGESACEAPLHVGRKR